jgi:nicotinamidase-related amidase
MKKLLAVIDMQKDFTDGALGTKEAMAIIPAVAERIAKAEKDGEDILFTKDTHFENYLDTQEGKKLPVSHCIKGTAGWNLIDELSGYEHRYPVFEKNTFGSMDLADYIAKHPYDEIELIGLCTDICVISNAMLIKAADTKVEVVVNASCCAGVTPQSHNNALEAMKACQITVI